MSGLAGTESPWHLPGPTWVQVDPIAVRVEALQLVMVTAYTTLLGGLAGVIWAWVGNTAKLMTKNKTVYLPTDDKFLLDNDLRFTLIAILGGLLCGLVLALIGGDRWSGPGAVIGLAAGGVLAVLVAAHVGHVIGSHDLIARIRHGAPGAGTARIRSAIDASGIDFKLGWWLGLVAWPFVAVGTLAGAMGLRGQSR